MGSAAAISLIYVVITIACVAMSAWSTYHGYESMFKEITALVTLVICAGLLACDIAILSWRRQGRSVIGIVLLLLLFTMFSAASNFNFFYTNFQRDRFAEIKMDEAKRTFEDNMSRVETVLSNELQKSARRRAVDGALQNLQNEVTDQRRGFGPRARELLVRLHEVLKPSDFQEPSGIGPGLPDDKNRDLLREISRRVYEKLDAEENPAPVFAGLKIIKDLRAKQDVSIAALPSTPSLLNTAYYKARIGAIKALEEDTADVGRRATQILAARGKTETIILKSVSYGGIELNNILLSAASGWEPENRPIAAALATLAILIDIIPLMFAMVFISSMPFSAKNADEQPAAKEADEIVILGTNKRA